MAASSKAQVLSLYRMLIKESKKFPSYNYRTYALRRVRDAFRENHKVDDPKVQEQLIRKAWDTLALIQRQWCRDFVRAGKRQQWRRGRSVQARRLFCEGAVPFGMSPEGGVWRNCARLVLMQLWIPSTLVHCGYCAPQLSAEWLQQLPGTTTVRHLGARGSVSLVESLLLVRFSLHILCYCLYCSEGYSTSLMNVLEGVDPIPYF
uniref:LYR motif containing 4 n=1 Tax=Denticeps clupeoides TaxID=299321 RepID=A0AAY4D897_9TELE